jgi:hydrogenase maturation protein HypF
MTSVITGDIYNSLSITVTGLVQGVGFRPFVYRIALASDLAGWVQNTNENVRIEISGTAENLAEFLFALKNNAPPAAVIENISVEEIVTNHHSSFSILKSDDVSDEITEISPDIAVCDECLADISKNGNRHYYAFVNCTNCGPRFTIIEDLPYDRAKTTMNSFIMCPQCRHEYETVTDRRFHAQPIACNDCGPGYELIVKGLKTNLNIENILNKTSRYISEGGVVLIKGLGGMHLACDALNSNAVEKLREIKKRDGKPFAVMFRNTACLDQYASFNSIEEQSLISWRRPIVLLEMKKNPSSSALPDNINSGLNLIGAMLPYMPFHYLLFERLKTDVIVLTSGNFSNEPIITADDEALRKFSGITDAIVLHNRKIFNRTDDSVVRIIGDRERLFRRSRGYVPSPVSTSLNTEGIIAFGAELTNCFSVGRGNKVYISQHIGDLSGIETTDFYEETIAKFIKLFRIKPSLAVVDMHPDYISTRTGSDFSNLPIVSVQHHHAHIASCMAEHRLDEKVIGVAFDGTGYGTDGNIWGSEFIVCDLNDFERITHFEYVQLPGGDSASEEPWRVATAWLYKVYGRSFTSFDLQMLKDTDIDKVELIIQMIDQNINCPLTSGAGRFFDAMASLLGLVQIATFQAEGPMLLEALVDPGIKGSYPFSSGTTICFDSTIRSVVDDILLGTEKVTIATKLHNTIINVIFDTVTAIREKECINKAVLSGGVFQNKYLLSRTTELLKNNGFEVFSHATVPTNDGGIALGQLAVASKRRELKCVLPFLQK